MVLFSNSILQGATDEIIANLPVIIIDSSHLRQGGEDNSCPICLNEMVIGEEARLLSCDHLFHKQVMFRKLFYLLIFYVVRIVISYVPFY